MLTEDIFVDTSAWIAVAISDDANHKLAINIYPSLLKKYRALYTSNLIIAECYILILKTLGHIKAIKFIENINASPRIIRLYSSEDIEEEAESILKKYYDQDFSYTDAVSFIMMKRYRMKKVFAFDRHFDIMRFIRIP